MEVTHLNGNCFMYKQKCVDPPGEVKPRGWIWLQIAKRLGFADDYSPLLAHVPDDKWDETVEELHRQAYEQWLRRDDIIPFEPAGLGRVYQKEAGLPLGS